MQIPVGESGFPTVSPTQLRTYGAGGFRLAEQEDAKGCPRLYHAKYVERRVEEGRRDDHLVYGSLIHRVLYLMEEEAIGPEEALDRSFPADLDPSFWAEAKRDLTAYLERGASPTDRFGTVAVETDLHAELYVDEEFGPIWIRGFVDWLGLDLEQPGVLHVVDYKTNRQPPSVEDVRGDVQLKTYDYLVRQNWKRLGMTGRPQVVVHLDAVKWREIEVRYDERDIEDWHGWAVAVVRRILRDTTAEPVLNPGCAFCPVRGDCPAFQALPDTAAGLIQVLTEITDPAERWRWRNAANAVRLLLEKEVKKIDTALQTTARAEGGMVLGETEWLLEPDWKTEIDVRSLHRALGDRFYDLASVSKKAIDAVTVDMEPHAVAAVKQCITRVPVGTKVVTKAVEG